METQVTKFDFFTYFNFIIFFFKGLGMENYGQMVNTGNKGK